MTNDKKDGFERLEGGEILRVWNRSKSQQEKKIETKISRGRKKMKWNKKREEKI